MRNDKIEPLMFLYFIRLESSYNCKIGKRYKTNIHENTHKREIFLNKKIRTPCSLRIRKNLRFSTKLHPHEYLFMTRSGNAYCL